MGFDNRCGRDAGRRWGTVADAFGQSHSLRYRADGARNNPPKLASVNYGIAYFSNSIPGDYRYADYKTHVTAALKKSFGNSASTGTKAIKIAADGGRRSADAVLAAQFRYYYSSSCGVKYRFEEGSSSFLFLQSFRQTSIPDADGRDVSDPAPHACQSLSSGGESILNLSPTNLVTVWV